MKTDTAYRFPSQFQAGLGVARYALKAMLRNKAGFVFGLVFPLTFVFVFGMLGGAKPKVRLGVSPTLSHHNPFFVSLYNLSFHGAPVEMVQGSEERLRDDLRHDRIAGIVEPAEDGSDNVRLLTTSSGSPAQLAAQSIVWGLVSEMNMRDAGITSPRFRLQTEQLAATSTGRYIDFALPGQIGFSMLSLATFGMGFSLNTLRKTLVLKRLLATSVRPFTFVVALCASRSVQGLIQTFIIIMTGVVFFHFTLAHGWLTVVEMLALAFAGIMGFLGFGILLANIARDDQSLPLIMNLFNLPQVLLAGVFFPTDSMPAWIRVIGNNLPLAYLNTSLRKAAGEGASLASLSPYVLGMVAWALVAYVAAARTFKTE